MYRWLLLLIPIVVCPACDIGTDSSSTYKSEIAEALRESAETGSESDLKSDQHAETQPVETVQDRTSTPPLPATDLSSASSESHANAADNQKADRRNRNPRFNKNHTLLVLAAEPSVRALKLIVNYRDMLDKEQFAQAEDVVFSFNNEYKQLLIERARVFENARDGDAIESKVEDIYARTLELNQKVQDEIKNKVLTKEQRELANKRYEENLRIESERTTALQSSESGDK